MNMTEEKTTISSTVFNQYGTHTVRGLRGETIETHKQVVTVVKDADGFASGGGQHVSIVSKAYELVQDDEAFRGVAEALESEGWVSLKETR